VIFIKKIIVLCLIPLFLLISIQICLKYPKSRCKLTSIEKYENVNYDYVLKSNLHTVELEITKGKIDESVEVYYNGYKAGNFNGRFYSLNVGCDGVVTIKNNNSSTITVVVKDYDRDIRILPENNYFKTGMSNLCKISLN